MGTKPHRGARPAPAPAVPPDSPGPTSFGARADALFAARWFVPVVLVLAAALRLVHLLALRHSPWFTQLQLDHRTYEDWAQRIHQGEWLGKSVFFVDPLYPYFLAGLYSFFGRDLLVVRIVQLALGVAACYLTALLGRRVFGPAVGGLACLLTALFIPSIYYEANIEKTALSVFLFTLSMVAFFGRPRRAALAAGVLLGLAALTRGNLLVFVPLGALALLVDAPGSGSGAAPKGRANLQRAALLSAGALAIILSASLRNYAVGGEFVLTTANLGQNLFIGNSRQNDTGTYLAPDFVRPDPRFEESDFKAEAEKRLGHGVTAKQASSFWRAAAVKEIAAAPLAALGHGLRKLRLFWHDYEVPDNNNIYVVAEFSPLLRVPVLWMGVLFPLALLGAVVTFRREPRARLVTLTALVYCASVIAFFVLSRFRIQIVPLLAVLASAGLAWLWRAVSGRHTPQIVLGAGVVLVGLVYSLATPAWLASEKVASLAVSYNNLGVQYAESGDQEAAIAAYERAVATRPESVVGALRALGELHLARKEYAKAEQRMRQVLELKPDSRLGRAALVRLYQAMLQDPNQPDNADVRRKLAELSTGAGQEGQARQPTTDAASSLASPAVPAATSGALPITTPRATPAVTSPERPAPPPVAPAATADSVKRAQQLYDDVRRLRQQERWPEAIAALQEAIRIGPYNEDAHYLLGSLMTQHASPEETIAYHRDAVLRDPKPQTSYYFWALGLERKGDAAGAIAMLQKALEIDPAHEMSQLEWGDILLRQGQRAEALAHYKEAVEILPEFKAAHEACAKVLRELGRDKEADQHLELAQRIRPESKKRYFYWGRYLVNKGRLAAAVPELRKALEADPNDQEARRLLDQALQTRVAAKGIDDDARTKLISDLSSGEPGRPVWFATYERDQASVSLQRELQDVFLQAGWTDRGSRPVPFVMKPGVYLFAADSPPPSYVLAVGDALKAAGINVNLATGYREYFTEMKRTKPGWQGFELAPDQTYVLVIGPNPR